MIKCVQCKDEYKPDYNLVKIGKFWLEVYNLDNNNGWNLCKWCEFSLNERGCNIQI